jgi:hypothetical protein
MVEASTKRNPDIKDHFPTILIRLNFHPIPGNIQIDAQILQQLSSTTEEVIDNLDSSGSLNITEQRWRRHTINGLEWGYFGGSMH